MILTGHQAQLSSLGSRQPEKAQVEHSFLWLDPQPREMELKPSNLQVFTSQTSDTTTGLRLSCLFGNIALKRSLNMGISSHRYCTSGGQWGLVKTCYAFSGIWQGVSFWPNVLNSDATELSYLSLCWAFQDGSVMSANSNGVNTRRTRTRDRA